MNFPAFIRKHCSSPLFKKWAIIFSFGLLASCASTGTSDDQLAKLCGTQNLSQQSHRTVLAGGYHALAKNDLVCAERLTLDARIKDPTDPYATLNLGAIYQRTGREAMAKDMYAKTIELDGRNKEQSKATAAHLATRDQLKSKRPAEIAKHNLALFKS
jgi:Flp pilus assembly protein TadD